MSWSYDPTDLNTTTPSGRLNTVRLLIGDTDSSDQKVQNEEIEFALSQTNNDVTAAAAFMANTLASKYAGLVTTNLDDQLMVHYSDLYAHYKNLSDQLSYQAKKLGAQIGIFAGGRTKTEVDAVRADSNRVKPAFYRGQFSNKGSS